MSKLALFLTLTLSLTNPFTALALAAPAELKPYNQTLDGYAYPFEVNYRELTSQQQKLKMAYMDLKPEKPNGKSIVLLHGKNFNGAYWERLAKDLSSQGWRVIMPDQIGFGKSSKPEHYQYSFALLASQTRDLLDSLGVEKFAMLGHSMGGMLAARLSLMEPERVEKLVLLNPIGLEDWQGKGVPYATVDAAYAGELKQTYDSLKKYQIDNYYGGEWKPEYEQWLLPLAGWTLSPDYPRVAWNSALTQEMLFTQPVVQDFGELKMPTLLIIGQRDRTAPGKDRASEDLKAKLGNYPQLGRQAAWFIPQAQLYELDNVGHLPHIEAYERFWPPLQQFLTKP